LSDHPRDWSTGTFALPHEVPAQKVDGVTELPDLARTVDALDAALLVMSKTAGGCATAGLGPVPDDAASTTGKEAQNATLPIGIGGLDHLVPDMTMASPLSAETLLAEVGGYVHRVESVVRP
jgi:hypothetical protein